MNLSEVLVNPHYDIDYKYNAELERFIKNY